MSDQGGGAVRAGDGRPRWPGAMRRPVAYLWAAAATALFGLAALLPGTRFIHSQAAYLPLHTALEFLAIAVSLLVFTVAWSSSRAERSGSDLLLGSAFLAVGLLDFAHTLSYPGMSEFVTPSSAEKAIDFWLMARLTASLALLAVALEGERRRADLPRQVGLLAGLLGFVVLVYWAVLGHQEHLPRTFIPGLGLTAFKILFEYGIVAVSLVAAVVLAQQGQRGRSSRYAWLAAAAWVIGLAELFFTLYAQVTDLFNLLGHLYKALAYIFIYRGLVVSVIEEPYLRLAEERTRFRTLYDAIPDCVWLKDSEGTYLSCNRALTDFLGVEEEQIAGYGDATLDAPGVAGFFAALTGDLPAADEFQGRERWIDDRAGRRVLIQVSRRAVRGAKGELVGMLGIARDITAVRAAEQAVYDSEELHRALVEQAPDAILLVDPDSGRFVEFNEAAHSNLGYSREEFADLTLADVNADLSPAETLQRLRHIEIGSGETVDVRHRHRFGEIRHVRASARPITLKGHRYVSMIWTDVTERKRDKERLDRIAHFDALTQLPNRMLLTDRIRQAQAHARRTGAIAMVCYLDLDGFRPVNEAYGGDVGDRLLIEVAKRLGACINEDDTAARLGGDEFGLLMDGFASPDECRAALDRVVAAIGGVPFRIDDKVVHVSASIGASLYPADTGDPDALLRHANQALFTAKQEGGNCYRFYDPEADRRNRHFRDAVVRIEQALQRNEFVLHYQPKVDMRSGTVVGAEALIRWQNPERGLVPPGEFLPLIEDSDFSVALGEWVLRQALRQMTAWRRAGLRLPVSVNVSARHLQQDGFAHHLGELLAEHPELPAADLELEVLETTALLDVSAAGGVIQDCRRLGVSVALDDFGTGYSSLIYFKQLPANVLKIDQSFVRDMLDDVDDLAIVEGIIGMSRAFRRKVIAEGVETTEHGLVLLKLGCDLVQGYGIARPMPAEAMPGWVAAYRPDPRWADAGDWAREDLPLLGVGLEHRRWIERLGTSLGSGEAEDLPSPDIEATQCRFGQWYYGEGGHRYGDLPEFHALEALHDDVHALAFDLRGLDRNGRPDEARGRLPELRRLSEQLLRQLDTLRLARAVRRAA